MYRARQQEQWELSATSTFAAVAVALSNSFGGSSGQRVSLEDFNPFRKQQQGSVDPLWHKLQMASFLPPEKRRAVEEGILGSQAGNQGG